MKLLHITVPAAVALGLSACSLGGLLGGGKTPPTLLTLTPQAAEQGQMARSASAGEAITISIPVIAKELRTVRVPAQVSHTEVAYIKKEQWVDTPDRLFQTLLAETVRRTTGRVVLDPKQAVIVRFDGALSAAGGTRVDTRRFEARVPSSGDAASVGPALNQAANQAALEAASWIAR